MNELRFQTFAGEYVLAVAEACKNLGMYRQPNEKIEKAALDITLRMLDRIKMRGIPAVENYVVNRFGGAFSATCVLLGLGLSPEASLAQTSRALQDYLDGRDLGNEPESRGREPETTAGATT